MPVRQVAALLGLLASMAKASPLEEQEEAEAHAAAALRKLGRSAEAQELLEATVARDRQAQAARLELGLVYRLRGQRKKAGAIWNQFFDEYENGAGDKQSARQLTRVAIAARYLGDYKAANALFRDAEALDPHGEAGALANIAWADMLLEKYDPAHAELSVQEALLVLPKNAEAHGLYARIKLAEGEPIEVIQKEIDDSLRVDAHEENARRARIELALDAGELDEALGEARTELAYNSEQLYCRATAAAIGYLRDDSVAFEAEKKRALALNPHAAEFFHLVAEIVVKQHRYEEANRLEAQALTLDPTYAPALATLGANDLRLGNETAGIKSLQRAWDRDPYNVRTYNLLRLFEEVIPQSYISDEGKSVRFRFSKRERAVLEHTVRPLVEREVTELSVRYGYQPSRPITVELYEQPDHYAVRTVGLPHLDAIGVCFGRVITAQSPSSGRFNWAMALWHEVAHVFALGLSRNRVPRWFTEGLSDYEAARERPEWSRRTHAELAHALTIGELPTIAKLDAAFAAARDPAHLAVVYHQAAEAIGFWVRRFGFTSVVTALRRYGEGASTAQVVTEITHLSLAEFDAAFRLELKARLAIYAHQFYVRPSDYSDLDTLRLQRAAHPNDGRVAGLYTLGLIHAGEVTRAKQQIADAHAQKLAASELLWAELEVAELEHDTAAQQRLCQALLAAGADGYNVRLALGKLFAKAGAQAATEREFVEAQKFGPERPEPALELARLHAATPAVAFTDLELAARLDVANFDTARQLIKAAATQKDPTAASNAARRAIEIAPFDADVRVGLAKELFSLGKNKDACTELALVSAPSENNKKTVINLTGNCNQSYKKHQ